MTTPSPDRVNVGGLVERLRRAGTLGIQDGQSIEAFDLFCEAADLITRLTAEREGLRGNLGSLLTEAEAMIVEIDGERGRGRETAEEILADPDIAECFSAVRRARAILALIEGDQDNG